MAFKMKGVPYPKKTAPTKHKVGPKGNKEYHTSYGKTKGVEGMRTHKHEKRGSEGYKKEWHTVYLGGSDREDHPVETGKTKPKNVKSPAKQNGGGLLPSENPDTHVYKGDDMGEKINDLEDRIEFIKEDISNQEGGATAKQKKDMAAMKKRIAKLKDKMERGKGSYGKEEYDKE